VDSLLKILDFEPKSGASKSGEEARERRKHVKDGVITGPSRRLSRPIIAICNDQYTRSLTRLFVSFRTSLPHSIVSPIMHTSEAYTCVCRYAPALRKLREVAQVLYVDKPDTHRLVARLKEICAREDLGADTRSLIALSELSENDIRSCLNTLQVRIVGVTDLLRGFFC
jgi:hypothetical protein